MDIGDQYLDLLKRVLTDTVFAAEPDANDDEHRYQLGFVNHYIRGRALTMLPMARLDNVHRCAAEVIEGGIPGDFIETGVWRGGLTILMRAIVHAYGVTDRCVWVADSFAGLPEPDAAKYPIEAKAFRSKIMVDHYRRFAVGLDEVRQNFARFGLLDAQVGFLVGWFKDTLPSAPIDRLALMHLDGDFYESTRDALVNLYPKLSPGGFVIIDDYGEDRWTYCRRAVDEFRLATGVRQPLCQVDAKCFYWQK